MRSQASFPDPGNCLMVLGTKAVRAALAEVGSKLELI